MEYTLNLSKITIEDYREQLKNQDLLPGRRILHQGLDANFDSIINAGIKTLFELKKALSTPTKISLFSKRSQIATEYLKILKREIGSMEQKPVLIKDFPGLKEETLISLENAGIKTSKDFYNFHRSVNNSEQTAEKLAISVTDLHELVSLCNLVRINGVGTLAARAFFEAGYRSIAYVANAHAEEMLARVTEVNSSKQYYQAKLGQKDMQFCIDFAGVIQKISHS